MRKNLKTHNCKIIIRFEPYTHHELIKDRRLWFNFQDSTYALWGLNLKQNA